MSGLSSLHSVPFGFDALIDQEKPARFLKNILKKGNVPQALLFTGIDGIGKCSGAKTIAMVLNCVDRHQSVSESFNGTDSDIGGHLIFEPCGTCRSCKKILAGTHPDIITLSPTGSFIKIDHIRTLRDAIAKKPFEARVRVVMIIQAHCLNLEAGNALLKMLEEPPAGTMFILTAQGLAGLLPTIVSRCHIIRFNPVSPQRIALWLSEKYSVPLEQGIVIGTIARGSLLKSLAMIDDSETYENWMAVRNWLIDEIESMHSKPIVSLLWFAEKLAERKGDVLDMLDTMTFWLRDLVIFKYCPDKIVNQDVKDRVQMASAGYSIPSLLDMITSIQATRHRISRSNVNIRLALETLAMQLANQTRL